MQPSCFHCALPLPVSQEFSCDVLGQVRYFCCPGCLAVAETICQNGLEQFYQFRTEKNDKVDEVLPQELLEIEALDNPAILMSISSQQDHAQHIELGIEGITCAACAWLIRHQVGQRPDVIDIQVNTTTRRASLTFDINSSLADIVKHIRQLGYRAYPFSEDQQEKVIQQEDKAYNRRLIVAGLAMMQVMMFATGLYIGDYQDIAAEHAYFLHWVSGLLATPVVAYSALPFFKSAWTSLKHWHFGMNLPVSIAIIAGYSASVFSLLSRGTVYYFDSVVMFTFFLLLGRYLEHRTRLKAILKQQNFKRLLPLSVTRYADQDEAEIISTASIHPGDRLLINAGSIIPIDGVLLDKSAEINESVITGEFLPVHKLQHDQLYSGATNTGGSFTMLATTDPQECRLQKLVQLQQNSENISSSRVSLADKIASYYVVVLLFLTLVAGFIWWQIDPNKVFPVVLSMLVVSCPCALSLATPAAVAAAVARLTDLGLMIKTRDFLSELGKVTHIYFDKTGTLTLGEMQLSKTIVHGDLSADDCLKIGVTLESISNHPIANAFKHLEITPGSLDSSEEIIAGGVKGQIDGVNYALGKRAFVESLLVTSSLNTDEPISCEKSQVIIYLVQDEKHLATFLLADTINPTANTAMENLTASNIALTLLSGDSELVCRQVAQSLSLRDYIADATPEHKLNTVRSSKSATAKVMMVGDGINDIGALSEADLSITMGAASQLSKASSNAVLVSHDLNVINQAIATAKKLDAIIKQNLSWAVSYNLIALPFAIAGLVPAWLAAIGMTTSSLIVVLNALRLRR